jgi:hypothetical protein
MGLFTLLIPVLKSILIANSQNPNTQKVEQNTDLTPNTELDKNTYSTPNTETEQELQAQAIELSNSLCEMENNIEQLLQVNKKLTDKVNQLEDQMIDAQSNLQKMSSPQIVPNSSGTLGDVKYSILAPTEFQKLNGNEWKLMDGQSIVGTKLSQMTGRSALPDARGMFIRGMNANREFPFGDLDGNRPVGSEQNDMVGYLGENKSNIYNYYHANDIAIPDAPLKELLTQLGNSNNLVDFNTYAQKIELHLQTPTLLAHTYFRNMAYASKIIMEKKRELLNYEKLLDGVLSLIKQKNYQIGNETSLREKVIGNTIYFRGASVPSHSSPYVSYTGEAIHTYELNWKFNSSNNCFTDKLIGEVSAITTIPADQKPALIADIRAFLSKNDRLFKTSSETRVRNIALYTYIKVN